MKILLIDFNDSFTAILAQTLAEAYKETVVVVRNIGEVSSTDYSNEYDGIVLGPGPGHVNEYKTAFEIVEKNAGAIPVLGICLGHQIISYMFGAKLVNLNRVSHGKKTEMQHYGNSVLFSGVPEVFYGGLYHSWVVDDLPDSLEITSVKREDNLIMSVKHKTLSIEGLQFHPESYMTEYGKIMLANWLKSIAGNSDNQDLV